MMSRVSFRVLGLAAALLVSTFHGVDGVDSFGSAEGDFMGYGMFGSRVTSAESMLSYLGDIAALNIRDLAGMAPIETMDDARQQYVVIDDFGARLTRIETLAKGVQQEMPSDERLVAAAAQVTSTAAQIKLQALGVVLQSQVLVKIRAILQEAEKNQYYGVPNRSDYAETLRAANALGRHIEILANPPRLEDGGLAGVTGWEDLESTRVLRELWKHTKDPLNEVYTTFKNYWERIKVEPTRRVLSLEEALAGLSVMTQNLLGVRLSVRVAEFTPTGYEFEVLVLKSGELRGVIYLKADPTRTAASNFGVLTSFVGGHPGASFATIKAEPVTATRFSAGGGLSQRLAGLDIDELNFKDLATHLSVALKTFLPNVELHTATLGGVVLPIVFSNLFTLFVRDWVDALFRVPVDRMSSSLGLCDWKGAAGLVYTGPEFVGVSVGRRNVNPWEFLQTDPSEIAWSEHLIGKSFSVGSTVFDYMKGSEIREAVVTVVLAAMIHSHGHYRQKIYDLVPYRLQEKVDLVDGSFPSRIRASPDETGLRFAAEAGAAKDSFLTAFNIVPEFIQLLTSTTPLEKVLDFGPFVEEVRASVSFERAALNRLETGDDQIGEEQMSQEPLANGQDPLADGQEPLANGQDPLANGQELLGYDVQSTYGEQAFNGFPQRVGADLSHGFVGAGLSRVGASRGHGMTGRSVIDVEEWHGDDDDDEDRYH